MINASVWVSLIAKKPTLSLSSKLCDPMLGSRRLDPCGFDHRQMCLISAMGWCPIYTTFSLHDRGGHI
jgi:hypothetical protein